MNKNGLIRIKTKFQKNMLGKMIIKIYHCCIAIPRSKMLLLKYYLIRNNETFKSLAKIEFYKDSELFDLMINERKSVCRFGDGEIAWIYRDSRGYFGQENSKELSERLKQVLLSDCKDAVVCVPNFFGNMKGYAKSRIKNRNIHLSQYADRWLKLLNLSKRYGDALITRVYNGRFNVEYEYMFSMWKKVWDKKLVVMIEGAGTRFGVGNDLLSNAANVERIVGPSENAFGCYNKLIETARLYPKHDVLFLIAMGPTATILAYDLASEGYQAIDIGHLDIEYEWFLHHSDHAVSVKGKYVNEAGGMSSCDLDDEIEKKYNSEIRYRCV